MHWIIAWIILMLILSSHLLWFLFQIGSAKTKGYGDSHEFEEFIKFRRHKKPLFENKPFHRNAY